MAVDNASIPDQGTGELEFGWSRDDRERGLDASVAYAPTGNLKIELNLGRARDYGLDPDANLRGAGVAVKWVPVQADTGLSAGLKLDFARVRSDFGAGERDTAYERAVTGLASWGTASGRILHVNLGREWVRSDDERIAANTWGVGVEQPLGAALTLSVEIFGAEYARPDKQIGLRYEVVDGLEVSAAVGRGSDRNIANAGVAWEF